MKSSGYCEKCFNPVTNNTDSLCYKCKNNLSSNDSSFSFPIIKKVLLINILVYVFGVFIIRSWDNQLNDMLIYMVGSFVSTMVSLLILKYQFSLNLKSFFTIQISLKHFVDILLVLPAFCVAVYGTNLVYIALYPFMPRLIELLLNYRFVSTPLDFLMVCLIGPVIEEVLFRGIIFQRMAKKWNIPRGITFSSLFFAVLHFPYNITGAFAFGVILCIMYLKTSSLILPIIAHILANTSETIYSYFYPSTETITELTSGKSITISILGLIIGTAVIWYYYRKNSPYYTEIPYDVVDKNKKAIFSEPTHQ